MCVSQVASASAADQSQVQRKDTSKSYLCAICKLREMTQEEANLRMERNLQKACIEHIQGNKEEMYFSFEELKSPKPFFPMQFSYGSSSIKGSSKTKMQEDRFFVQEGKCGILMGVFDGHGGDSVAQMGARLSQEKFESILERVSGNIYLALQTLLHEVHEEVSKFPLLDSVGSTAALCFIPLNANRVYVITAGDSEVNIYRKEEEVTKSIPLSCVRNWGSPKDFAKLLERIKPSERERQKMQATKAKRLFSPSLKRYGTATNVSRGIGDKDCGVSHKGKITSCALKPGDVVALGTDGLKDLVREERIIKIFLQNNDPQTFCDNLTNYVSKNPGRLLVNPTDDKSETISYIDDTTVIALKIDKS